LAANENWLTYNTTMDLDGLPEISFELSVTSTTETTNLNNLIVGRVGGPDEVDLEFRGRLYSVVGAAVVAGGRIEAAMKRLIIVLTEKPNSFAAVDKNWTELVKQLRREARRNTEDKWSALRLRVNDLLDRAEAKRLRSIATTSCTASFGILRCRECCSRDSRGGAMDTQ
jgi:hypothetical protein